MKGAGIAARSSFPDRILVLGSGALQIGQAGEFDYSGSQALKALREEGIHTVLLNPNIATIQTSESLADTVYFLPIDVAFVERILVEENIDGILLGFGGQTALNCGLALDATGVLQRLGVRVVGTSVAAIRAAEDRQLFNAKLDEIGVRFARSRATANRDEALAAAHEIGLPIILRAAFSLGGKGSAIVTSESELSHAVDRAFAGASQVLVEECLSGWKEIEYEIVRDNADNCIAVCTMENVDPMGIHTGESIVVAPVQTLDDCEVQLLRDVALRTIRHLKIVGECNIQFALDPKSRDYRVIEVNPRLSRSSALASKATGYPLAYVAAKIALGYTLPELPNLFTRCTTAFFEPALDYIVCKIPRWDFDKFGGVDTRLGPEMKSVGEVMAFGRSFPEALQKGLRMIAIGADGLDRNAFEFTDLKQELAAPSPRRIFAIANALTSGLSVDEVATLTSIDRFFLAEIARTGDVRAKLASVQGAAGLDRETMREAKQAGFSDTSIARLVGETSDDVRTRRTALGVLPKLAQIDTLAAEFPAHTNYLYLSYAAEEHDRAPTARRKVLVLGSGCYRIGSSVEFDWCCVNAVATARELGFETILLNFNPETVSTDYDTSDLLVFDEISLETVLELCAIEQPFGVIVSMGGQTPQNLALALHAAGIPILGTDPHAIDVAEDRRAFSELCDRLGIDQPRWSEATTLGDLERTVVQLGGFPVVVRPSYVLSGAAMRIAHSAPELREYVTRASDVSPNHPVVVSAFEGHSRELELDAVAAEGRIVCWAIAEHVENAGVHSGDATLVLPPQGLYLETIRRARRIAEKLALALRITGPFNVQMLSRRNAVKVIECNLRASRSLPFVSKVLNQNFAREAARVMLGCAPSVGASRDPLDLDYVAVKAPQFSFRRLPGVDPTVGIEMASVGEVACFGDDVEEALLKAMLATGFRLPSKGVLLSLGPVGDKYRFVDEAKELLRQGLRLYATAGTAEMLREERIDCTPLGKDGGGALPSAAQHMRAGLVDLVINIPRAYDERGHPDGALIRRAAIDLEIPLLTDLWLARRVVRAMGRYRVGDLRVKSWQAYMGSRRA